MKNILYLLIFAISFLVSAQDKSDELYQSIVANDYKKTEKLIEQGADVNFIKNRTLDESKYANYSCYKRKYRNCGIITE